MTAQRLCRLSLFNYVRFFENQMNAPRTSEVRGVSRPVFKRGMTSLSRDLFFDDRAVGEELLDVAERAAASMEDDDIIAAVEEAVDDEPIEPAAKRPAVAEAAAAVELQCLV
jgi:hypothetical protein